jgi:hypothetical protein
MRICPLLFTVSLSLLACADPNNADDDGDGVTFVNDCDDSDPNLGAMSGDLDCDGAVAADDCDDEDATSNTRADDADCDDYLKSDDCDDYDPEIYPGAEDEWYDGVDSDCEGNSDYDADEDGFDSEAEGKGEDCDDADASVNPDATDTWYDGEDTNCDGADDYDQDGDGYLVDGSIGGDDCDDTNVEVNLGAVERCDDIDWDCDGNVSAPNTVTLDSTQTFQRILPAIAASSEGSVIAICEGDYTENLEIDHSLHLLGMDGSEATIIDGSGSAPVITVNSGELTVEGLTLTNGQGAFTYLDIEETTMEAGGGILANGADALNMFDVIVSNNSAEVGAGVFAPTAGTLSISGCEFTDNEAQGGRSQGGAVAASSNDVLDMIIESSNFAENSAEYMGGAISIVGSSVTATLDDLAIENSSAVAGGHILTNGSYVEFIDVTTNGGEAEWGGGLYLAASTVQFTDVSISGGIADNSGGCLLLDETSLNVTGGEIKTCSADFGGGMYVFESTITGSDFEISGGDASITGGGAYLSNSSWQGGTVTGNDATYAAGVYLDGTNDLEDLVVSDNLALQYGGGLYFSAQNYGDVSTLTNVDITDNRAQVQGGGLYVHSYAGALLTQCSVTDNLSFSGGGGAFIETDASRNGDISLESVNSDWGTGSSDNDDEDVTVGSRTYSSYGAGESFSCEAYDGYCN